MRCEVVAVGTELLLGHVVDTNSAWLGGRLADAGVDCHFHTTVDDDVRRIADALRVALARSDAVIVTGGLGPTPDDVTREAVAEVMGVPLERDEAAVEGVRAVFAARGREMTATNARQGDVPRGALSIPQTVGTAPGLVCPLGDQVLYVVPGVPAEMRDMVERAVMPDLRARAGTASVIASRLVRTWGLAESTVAERLGPRSGALGSSPGQLSVGFVADPTTGVTVRLTTKAASRASAREALDAGEAEVRALLGPAVFAVDGQTMEAVVSDLLLAAGLALGTAESLTGGLLAARLVDVEGASRWFRGGVVAYAPAVKFALLGVHRGPVVTEEAAGAMAEGACNALGADVGLSLTGVAGPEGQDGMDPGTVFVGVRLDGSTDVTGLRLPGTRAEVRQRAATSALDVLRRRLVGRAGAS